MDSFSEDNDDSFSDDDIDIVAELQKTQLNPTSTQIGDNSINYQLQGQVAVLENQIEQLRKSYLKREEELNNKYQIELQQKDVEISKKIDELKEKEEQIDQFKDNDEFKTIDESLNPSTKKRKLNPQVLPTPPMNHQYQLRNLPHAAGTVTASSSMISNMESLLNASSISSAGKEKVLVLNQTSWYEDERSIFTESISNYTIPGTERPVFEFLADITSPFDYEFQGIKMAKSKDNFKSILLKFLIEFNNKHRIDMLIAKFIEILFDYINLCLKIGEERNNSCLLQIPFLLSLIKFSLNYRPKAISDELIQNCTKEINELLNLYPDIISNEINYLSLPNSKNVIEYISNRDERLDSMDYSFLERPMHIKILQVFITKFSIDILSSLASITTFRMESFSNCKSSIYYWTNIKPKLILNILKPLTSKYYLINCIDILKSSTFDNENFAFTFKRDNKSSEVLNNKIIKSLILLIDIQYSKNDEIYGLNYFIGDNKFIKLLNLLSPLTGELSSIPRTYSFEIYEKYLNNNDNKNSNELINLEFKIKLLELIEILFCLNSSINHHEYIELVFEKLCHFINKEQNEIILNFRSSYNDKRIKLISKSILMIKYLIDELNFKISSILNLQSKMLIIELLKISSNNMGELSYNFLKNIRSKGYSGPIFNPGLENRLFETFNVLPSTSNEMKIQLNSEQCNGIEFNYPNEIINISKEILIDLIGEQEYDKLMTSINYDLSDVI